MESQSREDSNALAMEEAVAVKRAVSKSSNLYNNSKWDLVDAIEDEVVAVSDIDDTDLPSELKGKSDKEIETYIKDKKSKRAQIQKEIQEANKKREAYIAKNQTERSEGELENAMLKAIKKQAEKKNYTWD